MRVPDALPHPARRSEILSLRFCVLPATFGVLSYLEDQARSSDTSTFVRRVERKAGTYVRRASLTVRQPFCNRI